MIKREIKQFFQNLLHRRCFHLDAVVKLVYTDNPESYAGGSLATGRVSQAGQVKG